MQTILPLLRPKEVAERLQVSERKVYRLLKAGELPGLRIGTCLRVAPEQLSAWLDSRVTSQER